MTTSSSTSSSTRTGGSGGPTDGCDCVEHRSTTIGRRTLFRWAGTGLAAGLATATTASGVQVAFGAAPTAAAATAPTGDVLVVLSLRGGFDGLSAVAPLGDPDYARLRPTLAVPASLAHQAGNGFGLHPALAPLFPFWDNGKLAAVHAVGQPRPTRSHFAAMEELERAAPGSSIRTGWINRTLGLVDGGAGAFGAAQVGGTALPPALIGPNRAFAVPKLADVTLGTGDTAPAARWGRALEVLHRGAPDAVGEPFRAAVAAVGTLAPLQRESSDPVAAGYPEGDLGTALHDVARLIGADVGLRVATVDFGDWDMHAGAGRPGAGWMHERLTELAAALAAFATELGPRLDRVLLLTLTEFGRRAEENGSGGTDHGNGTAVLALGGGVRGGTVHGRWPGLAADRLVDGDLAGAVDYRSVIAEVLTRRVGLGPVSEVFPGFRPTEVGFTHARA